MVLTAIATSIVLSLGASATSQVPVPAAQSSKVGAAANTPSSVTNVLPVLGDANDDVVRLQQAMVARGFTLKGGVDGVFSTRTQATLRNMQKAVGLRVTGTVDEPTARFLGLIVVQRLTPDTLPKAGDQGEAVWSVQQALITNLRETTERLKIVSRSAFHRVGFRYGLSQMRKSLWIRITNPRGKGDTRLLQW